MPRTSSDMLSIVSLTQYATNDSTQGVLVREPGRTRVMPLLLGLLLAYTCVLLVCSLDALSEFAQGSALDLSQNGIGHFGIPRQHLRLNHVSTLLVGCRGDRGSGRSSNINVLLNIPDHFAVRSLFCSRQMVQLQALDRKNCVIGMAESVAKILSMIQSRTVTSVRWRSHPQTERLVPTFYALPLKRRAGKS